MIRTRLVRIQPRLYKKAPVGLACGLPRSLNQLVTGPYAPGYFKKAAKVKIRYTTMAIIPATKTVDPFNFTLLA